MTRYLAMLSVLVLVVATLMYRSMGGGKLPTDFPRGLPRTEFVAENLTGIWEGPGLMHWADTLDQLVEAKVSLEPIGDSTFESSVIFSSPTMHSSEHGELNLSGENADWTLNGTYDETLNYHGWLADDLVWTKCRIGRYEYKLLLLFRTPQRLYLSQEIYRDSLRESWVECTLEKR